MPAYSSCPYEAIKVQWYEEAYESFPGVDPLKCNGCGACEAVCPTGDLKAIKVRKRTSELSRPGGIGSSSCRFAWQLFIPVPGCRRVKRLSPKIRPTQTLTVILMQTSRRSDVNGRFPTTLQESCLHIRLFSLHIWISSSPHWSGATSVAQ